MNTEEADRLALLFEIIGSVLAEPELAGWDGLAIVVQAYGPQAGTFIDTFCDKAKRYDRKIMVRLVKGASSDTKSNAHKSRVSPAIRSKHRRQKPMCPASAVPRNFWDLVITSTLNLCHAVAATLELADKPVTFEFKRRHRTDETRHKLVLYKYASRWRIYAPVGAHKGLIAHQVR